MEIINGITLVTTALNVNIKFSLLLVQIDKGWQQLGTCLKSCFSHTHTWALRSSSVHNSLYMPLWCSVQALLVSEGAYLGARGLVSVPHNQISLQHKSSCSFNIELNDGNTHVSASTMSKPVTSPYLKNTAQTICRIFLLNDTSDARTIVVSSKLRSLSPNLYQRRVWLISPNLSDCHSPA